MSDLISREALYGVANGIKNGYWKDIVMRIIDYAPSIDAVPVVRCKDCKECEIDEVFHDYWCNGRKVWKDHYCACGERRTDEQT